MSTRVPSNADVSVTVEAPARLHMGFFDLNGSLGRKYGSLGLTLDGLSTRVVVSRGGASFFGAESERAQGYLNRLRAVMDLPDSISVRVLDSIPSHAGLGSGTQLALALGTATSRLTGADLLKREWNGLVQELVDTGRVSQKAAERSPTLAVVGIIGSIDNDMFGTDITTGADTALHLSLIHISEPTRPY